MLIFEFNVLFSEFVFFSEVELRCFQCRGQGRNAEDLNDAFITFDVCILRQGKNVMAWFAEIPYFSQWSEPFCLAD